MALTRTAAELVADVRNRADHLVGTFRSDARIRRYLSESCRSVVSALVDEFDELYWASIATINTVAGQEVDDLPEDAWKVIMYRVTLGAQRKGIPRASVDDIDREVDSSRGWLTCWP